MAPIMLAEMADQNPDDSLSDRSLDNSQACSPASTNMQRPPVSGQNLSSVVLKDTDKTLIDEQGCNHPGESSSNAVPQDTRKRSISETKPSAHGQGLFNPLPEDTNAFARGSPVKSSVATKGQTSLQGDTKAFARGSIPKSSIATQGQTSLQGPFTPFAGRNNAFARGSVAKSSTSTQAQTSSQGLFINSAGGTFARESVAKSPIATQGETSLQPQSKRSKINSEDRWNLAVGKSTKLESSMRHQPSATAENKSSPSLIPTPQEEPIHHIREEEFPLIGEKCQLCNIDVAFNPTGSALSSSHNNNILPISACFPCGHCYHYNCLKGIYGSPGKGEGPPCFRCSEDVASSGSP